MDENIIDADKASKLEDKSRYRLLSREELLQDFEMGDKIAEIGSGTGFYTDDIADIAEKVYAVDFQDEMHEFYRQKGTPENVELVHSKASEIEIEDVDKIVSIFSFHEVNVEKALERFQELLNSGGKLIVYDWSSKGTGEYGPPVDKRLHAKKASEKIRKYFNLVKSSERQETFKIVSEVKEKDTRV